jgi:hypothetical protein
MSSNREALSSNPSTPTPKKRENEKGKEKDKETVIIAIVKKNHCWKSKTGRSKFLNLCLL